MPTRMLRDWTDSELMDRIATIQKELKAMPKASHANGTAAKYGPLKWVCYTKMRQLRLELAKRKGRTSEREIRKLIDGQTGICPICGKKEPLSIDHIVPVSMGGSDGLENLQLICSSCNSRKGARHG